MEDTDQQQEQQQPKTQEEILAARREARRKKILENTTNRLSKIVGHELPATPPKPTEEVPNDSMASSTGDNLRAGSLSVHADETVSEPTYIIYEDPPDERMDYINERMALLANSGLEEDLFPNAMGGVAGADRNGDIFQLLNTLNQVQSNGGLFAGAGGNAGTSQARSTHPSQPTSAAANRSNTRLGRVLRTKIHLVVASIAAYLLFATGNESYIGGNAFLPLLAWELIELLTIGASEPAGGQQLLGIVFLLGGIPMKTSQTIMKLMSTVNKVLKDVAFFMFFFVLTHLLWSRLWLGIELRYVLGYDQLEQTVGGAPVSS